MKEQSDLEKFKKRYLEEQKKHSLPPFEEMNEYFFIEKLADTETEFFIRELKRQTSEKLSSTLRVFDVFLNPSNIPTFLFPALKAITKDEKQIMEKIYKELSKNEILSLKLELVYSEQESVDYIKNAFCYWKEIEKDLVEIFSKIESSWDKKVEKRNSCYFG